VHHFPNPQSALPVVSLLLVALVGGIVPAQAEGLGSGHDALQHHQKAGGMHPAKHGGGCPLHGRKHGKDHAGGYGKVHGGHHGEGHARPLFGKGWTETLSAEQKAALDKLGSVLNLDIILALQIRID
jgi:hypothetical protein